MTNPDIDTTICPLFDNIEDKKQQIKKMIDTTSPSIVQAIFVILSDYRKQTTLKENFLALWRDAEKRIEEQ